jgi:hypothetical protein
MEYRETESSEGMSVDERSRPIAARVAGARGVGVWVVRAWALAAVAGGLLASAAPIQARSSANLTLYVYFGVNQDISVKLPDGTPVGTSSGQPTVIPAGYYTVSLEQPGCVQVPAFELQGPGVSIVDNLSGGEVTSHTDPANLLPSSTYTWRNDANRGVVYTFVTSSEVIGTVPPSALVPTATGKANRPSGNTDIVGSQAAPPFRGTLTAAVSAAGRLTLAYRGKSVTTLAAGRYRIAVTDRSTANGFVLEKTRQKPLSLTGAAFVGSRSGSVVLTAGRWTFMPRAGKAAFSIAVI